MPGLPDPRAASEDDRIVHASTVAVAGCAALIRGASGSGKSTLALEMIALGAVLVADDRTHLRRAGAAVLAEAPEAILGRIEARGVGLLAAPTAGPVPLTLVVDMDAGPPARLPEPRETEILGLSLPLVENPRAPHFPAALMLYLRHGWVE